MIVHAKISALKESRWYEYGARFALGGMTTLIAGVIGDRFGPETGGLFLAFPAIFCASATLIETHERKRKKEDGLDGYRRGTDAAALDASDTALGGIGLAGFGLMVWLLAPDHSLMSFVIASVTWLVVSIASWRLYWNFRRPGK